MTEIIRFRTSYIEPYPLQVVGESSYRDSIESLVLYTEEDEGVDQDDFIAHLVLENENTHDRLAVRVDIDHKTVGYLSRDDARAYRQRLAELGKASSTGSCYASVKGGFRKRSGEIADFGVRLDLDLSDPLVEVSLKPPAPAIAPRPVQPPPPKPALLPPTIPQRALKLLRWAFAPGRWWKTLLFLFFAFSIISAFLQD